MEFKFKKIFYNIIFVNKSFIREYFINIFTIIYLNICKVFHIFDSYY